MAEDVSVIEKKIQQGLHDLNEYYAAQPNAEDYRPVSYEEFSRSLTILLNTPPPPRKKNTKKRKKKI